MATRLGGWLADGVERVRWGCPLRDVLAAYPGGGSHRGVWRVPLTHARLPLHASFFFARGRLVRVAFQAMQTHRTGAELDAALARICRSVGREAGPPVRGTAGRHLPLRFEARWRTARTQVLLAVDRKARTFFLLFTAARPSMAARRRPRSPQKRSPPSA